MNFTRIFDIPALYLQNYPDQKVALSSKKNGEWVDLSIKEYNEQINFISYGLMKLGIQKGDKVSIIASSKSEWSIVDMAIMQIGAVSVPIYPTISQSDYEYILNNADIKLLFIDGKIKSKIELIKDKLPKLEYIYTFKQQDDYPCFEQLLALGKANPQKELLESIKSSIKAEDLATIIYTSGTTGVQKGVMLCHTNIVKQILALKDTPAKWNKKALSFLPLCHAYERLMVYLYQYLGISVYYAENLAKIADNIKEVNPTFMTCVPRLLEKIYDKIFIGGAKLNIFQRIIYYWAFHLAERYTIEERSKWYEFRHKIADKLIYAKWRKAIGGNFDIVVSGGSAIQKKHVAFFSAIGMPIFEGYGLSETSPVIAVMNREKGGRKIGTVGKPLKGIEVKIGQNNEILCRGYNVMLGYYKNPKQTDEVIDKDGWLHTGDTGFIDEDNALTITGRLKNIFKTSFGKYVNPQIIESKFEQSRFIEAICVFGENQKFVAALILPDFVFLKEWCNRHKIAYTTDQEMVENTEVIARFQKEVKLINKNFGDWEQIKKIKLISDDWHQMNFFTPTLKVKKAKISRYYTEEIEKLFS